MKLQSQKGNAIIWIAIVVLLVLVAVGLWWWNSQRAAGPSAVQPLSGEDTTSAIQSDLNAVDTGAGLEGDLDKELNADINSL